MKHIFWIHSHITFLMTEMVINYLKLKAEEVFLVTNRGYKFPRNIKGTLLYEIPYHKVKQTEVTEKTQEKWFQKINFNFELYVPHTGGSDIYELVHTENCKRYSYMEEGLLTYNYKRNKIEVLLHWMLVELGLKERMRMLDYTNRKFKTAFCLDSKAYIGCKRKIVLPPSFNNTGQNIPEELINKPCIIIIFDGIVEYGVTSFEESIKLLNIIINNIRENQISNVFYKLHPVHLDPKNKEEVIRINKVFSEKDDIIFSKLDDNIIMEELLSVNKQVTIYNFVSSLGLYANLLGNKVFSVSDRIDYKISKSIKKDWVQI